MSDSNNTFMSMKPEMKEVYKTPKFRFKKIKEKLMPKPSCGCEKMKECSCKKD